MWIKIGVTPNFVTILSMFLGAAAGWCFLHTELWWNVGGVIFMMLANFCDSTDGQMARLTNHKTAIGRMLDGLASDVWFFFCYLAIVIRLWNDPIPFTTVNWGIWIFLLCSFAGFYWHARQCQLADYYRQIHLYFLKGEEGSELASYAQQKQIYDSLPEKGAFWDHVFYYFYMGWCRKQEKNTPEFQRFFAKVKAKWPDASDMPADFREHFRQRSLPLMKYTNILTPTPRATMLFIGCLANVPWIYPLFEVTVLVAIYYYMKGTHERMCKNMMV
jgi:phosphatidylglycerophosphate synthase